MPEPLQLWLAYFVPWFDELKLHRCVTRVVIRVCVVTCRIHLVFLLCVFVWWAIVFQLSQSGLKSVGWRCSLVGDHLQVVEAFMCDIISYTWSSCVCCFSCVKLLSAQVLLVLCCFVNVSNCLVFFARVDDALMSAAMSEVVSIRNRIAFKMSCMQSLCVGLWFYLQCAILCVRRSGFVLMCGSRVRDVQSVVVPLLLAFVMVIVFVVLCCLWT